MKATVARLSLDADVFRFGATLVCVGTLAYFLYTRREDLLLAFTGLDTLLIAAGIFTVALQTTCRALRDGLLYRSLGVTIPSHALYLIQMRQNLLNHLPVKAGTLYSAAELKQRFGLAVSSFAAAFAAQSALGYAMTFLVAAVALLLVGDGDGDSGAAVLFVVLAGSTLSALFFRLPIRTERWPKLNRFLVFLGSAHRALNLMVRNRHRLVISCVLSLATVLLGAWRLQMLAMAGGAPIDYAISLLFAASVQLSLLVSITPAGIGVREGIVALVAGLLDQPPATFVIATALDRMLVVIYCGMVVGIGEAGRAWKASS